VTFTSWKRLANPGTCASPRRFGTLWVSSRFMEIAVAAGVIGLAWIGIHAPRQDRMLGSADARNVTGFVRFKVLRIWLPRSLDELAKAQTSSAVTQTHAKFQRFLATRNQKHLWYAITTRCYQGDGEFIDCTYIRHAYRETSYFEELLEVLAAAGGNPSPGGLTEFSEVSVAVMPDEILERDSQQAMCELLGDRSALTDHRFAP
jgi:hypothetical protein